MLVESLKIRKHLSNANILFRECHYFLLTNPPQKIPNIKRREREFFTPNEIDKLIAVFRKVFYQIMSKNDTFPKKNFLGKD